MRSHMRDHGWESMPLRQRRRLSWFVLLACLRSNVAFSVPDHGHLIFEETGVWKCWCFGGCIFFLAFTWYISAFRRVSWVSLRLVLTYNNRYIWLLVPGIYSASVPHVRVHAQECRMRQKRFDHWRIACIVHGCASPAKNLFVQIMCIPANNLFVQITQ